MPPDDPEADEDALGLSPTLEPDATLVGVAEVPLADLAAGAFDGWLDLVAPRDSLGRGDRSDRSDDDDGNGSSDDGGDSNAASERTARSLSADDAPRPTATSSSPRASTIYVSRLHNMTTNYLYYYY